VPEPFLHEVKGDSGSDGGDAEAVPQPLRGGVRATQSGGDHHRMALDHQHAGGQVNAVDGKCKRHGPPRAGSRQPA
jgi:hypothetical protein